jgi:hypothetical protein
LNGVDKDNYVLDSVATTTADITALHLTGSFTADNKVYDGNASATVLTRNVVGAIVGEDVSLSGGTATFNDKTVANGKTVTLSGASLNGVDKDNYVLDSVATTAANITSVSLTASITAGDKIYDGNINATFTCALGNGVIGTDDVNCSGGTAAFDNKNVGTGKTVTASGLGLSGADAGNYSVAATATDTTDITERSLIVSAAGVNKVYDGTANATVNLSDDRVDGDTFTASYTSASFVDKNVANGKIVNVSDISIVGTDAGNYTFNTTATATANITERTLHVSATGANKVFDGNTTATVTLADDRVAGDILTVSYDSANFIDPAVGNNKTINVTGVAVAGLDSGNYTWSTTTTATANITAWTVSGFYHPVDMSGVINTVKNGSTVPLKFEIFADGDELTDVSAVNSVTHAQVACNTNTQDAIEEVVTTSGGSVLRYDAMSGRFIGNWQAPRGSSVVGKCYRVTVTAADGSPIAAFFKMK